MIPGPDLRARLDLYLDLLLRWNRAVPLTSFGGAEEVWSHGFLPSLDALDLLPERGSALDVGSGGGIPAIPLALARGRLAWTLCEPSGRKAAFLREAARVLGADLDVRQESLQELLSRGPGAMDAVTARGFRFRRAWVRALASGLCKGGRFLVWTGPEAGARYEEWLAGCGLDVSTRRLDTPGIILVAGTRC